MPYIKQQDRRTIENMIGISKNFKDIGTFVENAGELNYVITSIIHGYFEQNGGRYQQANDIIGALEGAKLEFYRKIVAPYEETKIKENGDV